MIYHLTLEQGAITLRNGIYTGSSTQSVWSPFNPNDNGGWQNGDELNVVCTFNLNPHVTPKPPAIDYAGLCVGACNSTNSDEVASLESQARTLPRGNKGTLLGNGITTEDSTSSTAIFYNAKPYTATVQLEPTSRGSLVDYVYKWTMIFNGSNTITNGTNTEIIFGYGDPQTTEVIS
ncbi:MAG: hypothetical protein AAF570_11565 [Bacteroidota bacterium]